CKSGIVYFPLELAVVLVMTWVAVLVAVTLAPTITAPLGSVTVPVIVPRSVWAQRLTTTPEAIKHRLTVRVANRFKSNILLSPFKCGLGGSRRYPFPGQRSTAQPWPAANEDSVGLRNLQIAALNIWSQYMKGTSRLQLEFASMSY